MAHDNNADLLACLNAYTTAVAAFAAERPRETVTQLLAYLSERNIPARAIEAIHIAEGRNPDGSLKVTGN